MAWVRAQLGAVITPVAPLQSLLNSIKVFWGSQLAKNVVCRFIKNLGGGICIKA